MDEDILVQMEQNKNTLQHGDSHIKVEIKQEQPDICKIEIVSPHEYEDFDNEPVASPKKTVICTEDEFARDFGGVIKSEIHLGEYEFDGVIKSEITDEQSETLDAGESLMNNQNKDQSEVSLTTEIDLSEVHKQAKVRKSHSTAKSVVKRPQIKEVLMSYKCVKCDKKFSRQSSLQGHQRYHENPDEGEVNHSKEVDSPENIELQKQKGVKTKKTHKCNVCDIMFPHHSSLNRHINQVHNGEKRFQCDICDKKYSALAHLQDHLRAHSGEKPFMCNVCNKKFSRKSILVGHQQVHTREKLFKCEICDKTYTRQSDLQRHKRETHIGKKTFECDVCNKNFSRQEILKSHTRVHTGERPFKCEICDKTFSQLTTLRNHKRIHSGKKPLKCE